MSPPRSAASTGGGKACIAIYAPGNGLALYHLTDKAYSEITGINRVSGNADVLTVDEYGVVTFSAAVAKAEVFTVSGIKAGEYSDTRSIVLPETAGTYIVRFDGNVRKVTRR